MRVSLDDLKTGMKLATDLMDPGGRLLLPAETELTDRHLRYFQMWGVSDADIVGDDSAGSPGEELLSDPAIVAEAEARMKSLFRHADTTHPVESQILQHCLAREIRRLASAAVQPHA